MPDDPLSIPQGHAALQKLKDSLFQQYGQIPAGPVSDEIFARLGKIDAALTKLNQADMDSRTGSINVTAAAMKDPTKDLKALTAQIKSITNDFGTAAKILDGVDQFISGVTSYFGIL